MSATPQLSVPGRPQNNPLVTLNERLEDVISAIQQIGARHEYVLVHAGEGQKWFTACDACSRQHGRVVHPCEHAPAGAPAPPSAFDAEGLTQSDS